MLRFSYVSERLLSSKTFLYKLKLLSTSELFKKLKNILNKIKFIHFFVKNYIYQNYLEQGIEIFLKAILLNIGKFNEYFFQNYSGL